MSSTVAIETPEVGVPIYSGFIDHGNAVNGWFAGWGTAASQNAIPTLR